MHFPFSPEWTEPNCLQEQFTLQQSQLINKFTVKTSFNNNEQQGPALEQGHVGWNGNRGSTSLGCAASQ